ncbi:DUF4190 domain-containing protein [Gordonia phthalatica]|uniref:DUF4190 domain-containing protein n=1 Tax=Gordonia phthalatica TaxID=1136941 RepID=A0A0N9MPD3_9ACTN|nr:DUF4190 domain-containing protein [Gordonia phthalatica]ALG84065.1 hypothetical protein ACH46_05540 [Gordonia phthalatica]
MNNPAPTQQKSTTALVALILSIVSFVVFPFILSIAGLVVGYRAKKEIAASGGRLSGGEQAKWAVILGWISLIWGIIAIIYLATTL